ncbi:MAG: hypothetical protein ACI9BW_001415 [Gammaproteobacteria bacterium]
MSNNSELCVRLESALDLSATPVAVRFQANPSEQTASSTTPVAAGCKFWEMGTKQHVATVTADHRHCSIGIHTHNLQDAPPSQGTELSNTLAAMQGLDYVRAEEVANLPVMKIANRGVTYAPLKDIEETPDVVLIFANAAQGLILSEAVSRVDGAVPAAMGRPACALIPQVINTSRSTSSLGCCGARAYLDVFSDDISIWGLLGSKLDAYVAEIETLAKANSVLRQFHEMRGADILSGGEPTVQQSLERLA